MAKTESTHDVAEKTDASGGKTRIETESVKTSETRTSSKPAEGGRDEPKQIKPDGR